MAKGWRNLESLKAHLTGKTESGDFVSEYPRGLTVYWHYGNKWSHANNPGQYYPVATEAEADCVRIQYWGINRFAKEHIEVFDIER